jgi:hypothetical protein
MKTTINLNERPDIIKSRHRYGILFGSFLGVSFAIATWGIDAYILSQAHGLHPWMKFAAGALPCMFVGGLAGRAAAQFEKSSLAVLFWLAAALFFAWLTVALPLRLMPTLMGIAEPGTQGLLHHEYYENFASRIGVATIWVAIFVCAVGLVQLPISESAVFSASFLGKVFPLLVTAVIMGICGVIVDSLNNEPLRTAATAMHETIQFSLQNQGREIDKATSRRMHQGSLRGIRELLTEQYGIVVSGYDEYLGNVQVLVKFEAAWAECTVVYNQPVFCKEVTPIP